jgi:hypothetical protein
LSRFLILVPGGELREGRPGVTAGTPRERWLPGMGMGIAAVITSEGTYMAVSGAKRPDRRLEAAEHVCNICGKPSESTICEACSERLGVDALVRKKHEEQGNSWSRWE